MSRLDNKVAVVTGASKGIGAGIAKQLAAAGATVVVNYLSSREGADQVVDEIVAAGGKAVAIGANVGVESEVARMFDDIKSRFGRVDVLVNNAGIYNFAPLEGITPEHYKQIYDINVLGVILASKAASPLFPQTGGAIINISSIVSTLSPPAALIYVSTKSAVDGITRSMAKELAGRNIRVNGISPGLIVTEGQAAAGILGSDLEKYFLSITPLAAPAFRMTSRCRRCSWRPTTPATSPAKRCACRAARECKRRKIGRARNFGRGLPLKRYGRAQPNQPGCFTIVAILRHVNSRRRLQASNISRGHA